MARKPLRIIATLLAAFMLLSAVIVNGSPAYAQSPSDNTDTSARFQEDQEAATSAIWSGLWEGVDLATGTFTGTSSHTSDSGSAGQSANAGSSANSPSTTATTTGSLGSYAALGDSVAAGVGLANPTSVPANEARCDRTSEAYPYQVAQTMGLSLIHAACSGATVGDLFTDQRSGSPNLPPQLDAAYQHGTPRLITITAGANDIHWTQFISSCYYSNCAGGAATPTTDCPADGDFFSTTTLANCYIRLMQAKMYVALSDIWIRSGGKPPTTVMTGYYNPISAACASQFNGQVTADEINWIDGEINALNQTLQGVASNYSFVKFAPVSFAGHDVCSDDSWVQTTADPQPFHPTTAGQQAIARSVLSVLGR